MIGSARLGERDGVPLGAELTAEQGQDPRSARAVAGRTAAGLPGTELGYLAADGFTGAAEVAVPWFSIVRTTGRADMDLTARSLLGVRGTAEYRHPCGCLAVGLLASYRKGRGGTDVAGTIDLVPR
jgi:hypothetical protein